MQIQLSGLLLKFRTKKQHPFLIQSPNTNFNISNNYQSFVQQRKAATK